VGACYPEFGESAVVLKPVQEKISSLLQANDLGEMQLPELTIATILKR
jgi:hypothetical protein